MNYCVNSLSIKKNWDEHVTLMVWRLKDYVLWIDLCNLHFAIDFKRDKQEDAMLLIINKHHNRKGYAIMILYRCYYECYCWFYCHLLCTGEC